jgi:dTDP-4-amino-4,6-dideoxygalactose transaminase
MKLLGIGPGDEVVVSDFSFPATANIVEDVGARPVFADVSLETYNMLPEALEARIGRRTRAVIFVDCFGNPAGLAEIAGICRRHELPLIEDAACALGSSERGVRCGNAADLSCLSFHPRKLLTTGEGGAILCNRQDWSDWLRIKLAHGAGGRAGPGLDFVDYGYNYRLSEPQALMGCVQIDRLDAIVAGRNAIRNRYVERLAPMGFQAQHLPEGVQSNVQSVVFRVPDGVSRDHLVTALSGRGIESTLGTYCLSGTSFNRARYADVQPNAWRLYEETITLPCFEGLDVDVVCDAISDVLAAR